MEMPERGDSGGALAGRESILLGAVLIATAMVYLRCLGNGFVYDDAIMIVTNRCIKDWSFLWKSFRYDFWWFLDPSHLPQTRFYRPLADAWLGLNYHVFGLNAFGWHATQVALHLVVVWLVFRIAQRLARDASVALLAALLFGLLPFHAEAVAWPSAACHLLGAVFELAAFYLVIDPGSRATTRRDRAGAVLLYGAALLSIESTVMFPALVASYFLLPDLRGGPETRARACAAVRPRLRRAFNFAAPFAVEALLYLIVRRLALWSPGGSIPNILNGSQVLMEAPRVLASYAGLLVLPWRASPAHRVLAVTSVESPEFYLPALGLPALAATSALFLRRHPHRSLYLFCAAWMAITIAPTMNLSGFRPELWVQDRYLYLPSVGWCVLIADFAVWVGHRSAPAKRLVQGGAVAAAAACAVSLWSVQRFWHDDLTLFARCIEVFPEAGFFHFEHEKTLVAGGDFKGAARECDEWLGPKSERWWVYPDDMILCGSLHVKLGQTAQGAPEIAAGLAMKAEPDPVNCIALARLYETQGDSAAAEHVLRTLLARDPDPPAEAYLELAKLCDAQGRSQESDALLRRAESTPEGAETALLLRAQLRMKHGDAGGAEAILRQLAARYSGDPHVWTMLGLLLADENRGAESLRAFDRVQQLTPGDPEPHFFAARVLHALGRDPDALQQCRRALALAASSGHPGALALMTEIERGTGLR